MNNKLLSTLFLTSLISLTACQSSIGTGGNLDKIVASKTLVVGTNAEYAPFEYLDGASQTVVGFDIDVVALIESAIEEQFNIDLKVEIKDMAFDGLIGAMTSNQIDFIAAAFTRTDERAESVLFSDIYYQAETVLVVKQDQSKISDYASLTGLKLGAQLGTVQVDFANEASGDANKVKALGSLATLISDLEVGNLDALLVERPVALNILNKNSGYAMIDDIDFADDDGYAFASNYGSEDLINLINGVITSAKSDGSLDQLFVDALTESLA